MIPLPSLVLHPQLLWNVALHPMIFLRGWREGRGDTGVTYDGDAWSRRSMAYDCGRDLRRLGLAEPLPTVRMLAATLVAKAEAVLGNRARSEGRAKHQEGADQSVSRREHWSWPLR